MVATLGVRDSTIWKRESISGKNEGKWERKMGGKRLYNATQTSVGKIIGVFRKKVIVYRFNRKANA